MDNNRILDDLTRVAGGAFTVLSTLGKQVKHNLQDQMGGLNAHPANDDVARLQATVSKLRMEQEDLKKRVAELEAMLGKKSAPKKAATKPVAKKAAPKKTAAKAKKAKK